MPNVAADLTRILGRERVLREPEHLANPEESHEAVQAGTRQTGPQIRMMHPVSLQAQAYRSRYPNRKA